ncbi:MULTISPECIES: LysR family transcriptional regulator [Photobacterium]|mgnify:CR=1 FL=1|uniref:LysR family transcriptional regulator n=1 Tax=Photobacterium halotolerans TaxID=265726 RepID=A0A0F5VHX5_9GAMM|nr:MULTISPECIES: LysR family transcriptional regulator [Photobacterium]KKD01442.1 LysR family transcriptional regulator [Photobacterium halotolerans]UIP27181.1 LysR family transcriptional regulator [Photobacterium sp. TLY01]
MKLDDLNLFRIVVEEGSYTAASRKHQVPVATLTRRIQALEDSLDLRLLNRHARKLSLTEAGQQYYQLCTPMLQQLLDTAENIRDESRGASGRLKIAAPTNLSKVMLQPMLNAFMLEHPAISIELFLSNEPEQLDPTDWDVIFRVGPQRDSALIARKINAVEDILVASPDYLQRQPALTHAQDLSKHSLLKGSPLLRWRLTNKDGETITVNEKGRFESNQLNVVRKACVAGLGITLMPDVMLEKYIHSGELVRVLDNWSANPRNVYLLYNHKDHQPEKLRLFIEFASHFFSTS